MNNLMKILAFISLFAIVILFTGAVSAANYAGSPGNNVQIIANNTHNNDSIIVNDNNSSVYTNTENITVNKNPQLQSKEGANTVVQTSNQLNTNNTAPNDNNSKYLSAYSASGIHEQKAGNIKIDHQTGKYIIGGTIIAGGAIMTGAGVAMGWNPVGWAA
jgi:hypothetical protein